MNAISFEGKVAIVTGAGNGLGKSHALELARRGAKVVVNDFGGDLDGTGSSKTAAETVAEEINKSGGEALANSADVSNVKHINDLILKTLSQWGRIDILVNNAGILRDKTFAKMDIKDFKAVVDVHLIGSAICTKAVWEPMREQKYGRIVFTSSSSGIYGNFGQSNYAMAKMSQFGFAYTLAQEGAKRNIHCNVIAPGAGSRMTLTVMPEELVKVLKPDYVSPIVAYLCHEDTEDNGVVIESSGGWFAKTRWQRTSGAYSDVRNGFSIEDVANKWDEGTDFGGETQFPNWSYKHGKKMGSGGGMSNLMKLGLVTPARKAKI